MSLALRTTLPKFRDRRRLDPSGLVVSPFCLGMVADPKIIPAAFDAGVNFFFLSVDKSWHYFEKARRGLAMLLERGGGIRDDVVVAAATYIAQPEFAPVPFFDLLSVLPTLERIDLPLIGGTRDNDFFVRLHTMRRMMRPGPLGFRALGATFQEPPSAVDAVNQHLVDIAFAPHNNVARGMRDVVLPNLDPDATCPIYGLLSKNGAPTPDKYAALGLDPESWIPGPVDQYRYALSFARLDGILFAMGGVDYLEALIAGLDQGPLDAEELDYMSNLGDVAAGRATLEDDPEETEK